MIPALETPSGREIERFRAFVTRRFGLRVEEGHVAALGELLRRRAGTTGRPVPLYLDELEEVHRAGAPASHARHEAEARTIAAELTVGETYFFRDTAQLGAFSDTALPDRARARASARQLRILSAACASGEEAYSLAILSRDFVETIGWQAASVAVTAFDVNVRALERASAARYGTWAFRETPDELKTRCFRADGRHYVIDPALRPMVSFHERNLTDPDPAFWAPDSFDVVFCRNVIMYFTPEVASAVVARIARSLAPGGFLFLGYAETLRDLSRDFHLRHTQNAFYYQLREDYEARVEPERGERARDRGPPNEPPERPFERLLETPFERSWVETIRRASERIHSLTSAPAPEVPPAARAALRVATTPIGAPSHAHDVARAVELIRLEKFSEADAALSALPAASARDADVLLLRAVLLTHGGDLAAAETLCARVLALDEMSAGAHYLTALCREDAGDPRGAADHDQVAVYLDPSFAMPRLHLGLLARRGGDPDAARRELEAALGLLLREDPSRLLLFAGGFSRDTLVGICRAELAACGGAS